MIIILGAGGKKPMKILKQILCEVQKSRADIELLHEKVNKLSKDLIDSEVIKQQAEILDQSTNELKEAVDKNTPAS